MSDTPAPPPVLDLGGFGRLTAGENVGNRGVADGQLGDTGWFVLGGIVYAPDQRNDAIAAEYGWAAAFLDHREIGPLLQQAAEQGWTMQKLQTELRQTDWWQNTTAAQRDWDSLSALDPAEAAKQVDQTSAGLQSRADQLGANLTTDQLDELAARILRNGWTGEADQSTVTQLIVREALRSDQQTGIRDGILGQELRTQAADMAIPVGGQALDRWIRQIAKGKATVEDYSNYLRDQAKGLYGALADDIDRGLTVKTLADPYLQTAANILGTTAEQMDLTKGKWNKALNFVDDSGKRRTMTLAEWENELRTNDAYGYLETEEAQAKAYSLAETIKNMFGKV